jgi:hypothetical protein
MLPDVADADKCAQLPADRGDVRSADVPVPARAQHWT